MVVYDIARHQWLKHSGTWRECDLCPKSEAWGHLWFTPSRDFGVLVTDGPRLVERSAIVARLLVP